MLGRTQTSHLAAWLALFSVAMLFVAPVISRTITHHIACEHTLPAMAVSTADRHHDMSMHTHCESATATEQWMVSGTGMSPMEEIACGYCQLLVHLPFVLTIFIALLWQMLLLAQRSHFIVLTCSPLSRPWRAQRARAPPTVLPF